MRQSRTMPSIGAHELRANSPRSQKSSSRKRGTTGHRTTQSGLALQAEFADLESKLGEAERMLREHTTEVDEAHQESDELRTKDRRLREQIWRPWVISQCRRRMLPDRTPSIPPRLTRSPLRPRASQSSKDSHEIIARLGETDRLAHRAHALVVSDQQPPPDTHPPSFD